MKITVGQSTIKVKPYMKYKYINSLFSSYLLATKIDKNITNNIRNINNKSTRNVVVYFIQSLANYDKIGNSARALIDPRLWSTRIT